MNFQSLVDFSGWTFIAQVCNLFLQMYLFKRFLFKPIKDIIAKRQAEVNAVYQDADTALEDAKQAKTKYEACLETAHEQAQEITAKAAASAQLRSEQIVSAAEADAAQLREKASRDIELERRKAMQDAKNEISDLAVELASKLVRREISREDHEQLMEQFIEELGEEA